MTPEPAPTTQTQQSKGWSPARRAAQAEAIRRWRPWAKSTGPKTAAGKARVAQNAAKATTLARLPHPDKLLKQALRDHDAYLLEINRFITARKKNGQNKLLKRLERLLQKKGRAVTNNLQFALAYAKLCKNLAFRAKIPIKVNANDG